MVRVIGNFVRSSNDFAGFSLLLLDVAQVLNIQNDCKQILGLPWWPFLYFFFLFLFHFGFTVFSKLHFFAPSTCGGKQTKTAPIAKMVDSKISAVYNQFMYRVFASIIS